MNKSWIALMLAACAMAQSGADAWITHGRTHAAWRYVEFDEINASTVSRLAPKWIYQAPGGGHMEVTPLVFGGLMYITGSSNNGYAIDVLTGRPVWRYSKNVPADAQGCCGTVNRGFATVGDRVFKVNFEAKLVALDSKTGSRIWETTLADYKKGYSSTVAPLAVKDKVVVGIAGAEFGTRGFIDAYSAQTGERLWRFWTIPAPDEPGGHTWSGEAWKRGGGSAWVTGSYDPELNLIYWGTGNPGPDMNGDVRPGDNLYSCSVVAIDADTGKLKWHYQFTPHDVHDWDATEDMVLADLDMGGRKVKALIHANRNGFYYTLDRTNGKVLVAKSYTKVSWATGIGADGRPILVPGQDPTEDGNKACPGLGGGHNWQPTAYSPQTGLYYFGSTDGCHLFYKTTYDYIEGQWYQLSTVDGVPHEENTGSVVALNPRNGDVSWRLPMISSPSGGMLATGGGLLFTGDREGYFVALDAKTGKLLWKFQTGGAVTAGPVSYRFQGKQYVAVAAGSSILVFALP
ncbi:MAG TPA: PQQ-dependent dehydrogenase, methanol/ethanol family [Bryobacteraceae bacterium]|nr:PQQ-dependent dehydrogenase, methanol/ethanol family [Bryobacteraceae bacterium]